MKKTVYLNTAIKAVAAIFALILILSVYPGRMWVETHTYQTPAVTQEKTPVINYLNNMMEVFVASEEHLQSIRLYVNEGTYTKEFNVELTDGNGKHINTVEVSVPETLPGYVDIVFDADTTLQELDILKFSSLQSLYLGQETFDATSQVLVVPYYNDAPMDAKALIMDFNYRVPVSTAKSLLLIGVIVLCCAVIWALADLRLKDSASNRLMTVESVMKRVLNPLAAILLATCLVFIALGYVSSFAPDNIFAVVSVILLGLVLFYAINHKRSSQQIITTDYLRSHIPDIIQSLGIAFALQACCEYVSGLYDIHHRVAERKEIIGFAIAVIAMFAFSEVFNLYNLVYVIGAIIAGVVYYNKSITPEMSADDLFVIKGNAIIAVLLGLILIRTVKGLVQKKLSIPALIPSVATVIYFALIIVFRNTRWWTVVMAASFTLFYLNCGMWDRKKNVLTNITRGVMIQFILCTVWCLMHRPYTTFRSARYTHFFHTETITATYMTMVSCVALVMLLSKISTTCLLPDKKDAVDERKSILLRDIWKELVLFGAAVSYLLFTMARTAYAATIVAFAFALIMVFAGKGKRGITFFIKTLGWMCVSVLVMLPITFEAQRTLPALVSDPYEYDIDEYQDNVMHGRNLSSPNYMLVGRLWEIFSEKILGTDEGAILAYYNDNDQIDIYHATLRQLYDFSGGYDWPGVEIKDEDWDMEAPDELFDMYVERDAPAGGDAGEPLEAVSDNAEQYEDAAKTVIAETSSGSSDDYTNGRTSIYRSYIAQMNMTGHDSMGAILEDGEEATHAHDVYLQVAYDHGIPTGIIFVIFGIILFVYSIIYFIKSDDKYRALTMTVIIAFAIAGVVEWVFHLSHPMSFVMLLSATPIMFFDRGEYKKDKAV